MLDVDEDEKLTGEEEFELLAGPLGLNDRRIVPEPVQFPDSDPLGASVAMVTATNSMEETLMQIGKLGMLIGMDLIAQESSPTPQFKSINSLMLSLLYGPTLTSVHDYWKNHRFD